MLELAKEVVEIAENLIVSFVRYTKRTLSG